MQCGLSALEATPVSGSSAAPSGYATPLVSNQVLTTFGPLPANTRQASRPVGRPTPHNLTKGSSTPSGCPMRHCCSRDGKPLKRCTCRLPDCLGRGSIVPDAAAIALRMSPSTERPIFESAHLPSIWAPSHSSIAHCKYDAQLPPDWLFLHCTVGEVCNPCYASESTARAVTCNLFALGHRCCSGSLWDTCSSHRSNSVLSTLALRCHQ